MTNRESVLDQFYEFTPYEREEIERVGILKWLSDNSDRIMLWPPCADFDCRKRGPFRYEMKKFLDRIYHIFAYHFPYFFQRS